MSEIKLYLRVTIPFVRDQSNNNYKTTTLMTMIMTVMEMVLVLNGNIDGDGDDDSEDHASEGRFTSFAGHRGVLFNLDFR